jgi:alkylation response protein AidB-like acyl-CoA dehydrogenase
MAALTEEQTLLKEQAKTWAKEEAPVAKFREMRDSGTEAGFDKGVWASMGEMGWAGILIPEDQGGVAMGHLTFGLVLEELGRQLTASPLLASAGAGASAILAGGNESQKNEWLPAIADGSRIVTLAVDEKPRHAPQQTNMGAKPVNTGFVLNGQKVHVAEGLSADAFVVAARTSGQPGSEEGLSLFLVAGDTPGLNRTRLMTADSRGYANLEFSDVEVPKSALLGKMDQGNPLLDKILDCSRAHLAAEMLGVAAQSFDMTLDYLKNRIQFGQPIGSFQALGHRASTLYTEMEMTRSCVEAALQALNEEAENVAELCSLSKCKAGQFLHHMSNELIQIHGGIGMTDEFDAGLYLKRARSLEFELGNEAFHRDRFATLRGF